MLAHIVHADIHQLYRVQRAPSQMRRGGSVRGAAGKGDINAGVGWRCRFIDAGEGGRVPSDRGWIKLAELPEDELPGYEDGYTEEQNEPPIPKLKYAIGSVESEAETKQIVAAREAAAAQRETWRLARVAAFLQNKV